jgi:selenocysteine-specific elongation factor
MIVVTAGHVDHGKSTLVRLLTGVDPDRWDEERRRGLTIDLGFAWTTLASGRRIGFVDVPGHERFLRNMLAGCGATDLALLVVSAREGWKPQTEEHLQILDLLGVQRGLVALTHADVVDQTAVDATEIEVRERVRATFLAGTRIVHTGATDEASIERLREVLDEVLSEEPEPELEATSRPRLWIDRSFSLAGAGRIVTGTLAGGCLAVGDRVVVSNGRDHQRVRIRGVHEFGEAVRRAEPGTRVALNLAGTRIPPRRGHAVFVEDKWRNGSHLHVALRTVRGLVERPRPRGSYMLFIGTMHVPAQLSYPAHTEENPFAPDLLARLRLEHPVGPVTIGDGFILRDEGRGATVAGGVVLAVADRPTRRPTTDLAARWHAVTAPTRRQRERQLAAQLIGEHGGAVGGATLDRDLGTINPPGTVLLGDQVTLEEAADQLRDDRARRVDDTTRRLDTAVERVRAVIDALDPPFVSIAALTAAGTVDSPTARRLVDRGDLVSAGEYVTTRSAFERFVADVRLRLSRSPASLAELRASLGVSRKHAVALLEAMDARGITRRVAGVRTLRDRAAT